MSDLRISALTALSLAVVPIASFPLPAQTAQSTISLASSQRASLRNLKNLLTVTPTLEPMGTYVGQLQEKWQFPSDHLPIGISMDELNIVSWNVLDAKYMSWVTEKDSQGLVRSMIVDEHVYIGDSKLTVRDKHVADLVLEMISHPTHPRNLLSLQECSESFVEELCTRLPTQFDLVSCHGEALLFDKNQLELVEAKEMKGIFSEMPERAVQEVIFKRISSQETFRLINTHLPGNPDKPGRFEFAKYLSDTFDPNVTTIAIGDMNFNEIEMSDAMTKAFISGSPFSIYTPYCTNISPFVFNSKAIDHFIVYSANGSSVSVNAPNEVMKDLDALVALLEKGPQDK